MVYPNLFFPSYVEGTETINLPSQDAIRQEPQIFAGSPAFAWQKGGSITRAFLTAADIKPHDSGIINSRVHMLFEGMCPAIGGWHLDDVPRRSSDGQPDVTHPWNLARHHIMMIAGDASRTQFLTSPFALYDIPEGGGVSYRIWDKIIDAYVSAGVLDTMSVEPCMLYKFTSSSFHRAVAADRAGWRFFIRYAQDDEREARNELRTQTQVYTNIERVGW